MKKKLNFRKKFYCAVVAFLSFFTVCGNLHAANDSGQSLQESTGITMTPEVKNTTIDGLTGTWIIDRVKIKKTVNDVPSENTYSLRLKQQFKSFTDCPKTITFTVDGKVIMEYDGKESTQDSYTVEGNQIQRMTPVAEYEYEYAITDSNNIQLVYSINYVDNSGNKLDNITEEYTFFGTKQ